MRLLPFVFRSVVISFVLYITLECYSYSNCCFEKYDVF
jgi:hypothetical protein